MFLKSPTLRQANLTLIKFIELMGYEILNSSSPWDNSIRFVRVWGIWRMMVFEIPNEAIVWNLPFILAKQIAINPFLRLLSMQEYWYLRLGRCRRLTWWLHSRRAIMGFWRKRLIIFGKRRKRLSMRQT